MEIAAGRKYAVVLLPYMTPRMACVHLWTAPALQEGSSLERCCAAIKMRNSHPDCRAGVGHVPGLLTPLRPPALT
jgi:hypothetical protein